MWKSSFLKNNGLTLIELMIAMAVVSILSAAIFTVYESQVRGQNAQEAALEMQQGLRSTLTLMAEEIRTAGADPTGNANSGIQTAEADKFRFTRDVTGGQTDGEDNDNDGTDDNDAEARYPDGNTDDGNEDISYAINSSNNLGRQTGGAGGHQSILNNVDALNFVYLDREGDMLNDPTSLDDVPASDVNEIRSVEVTIVFHEQSEKGLLSSATDSREYENQQGDVIFGPANDSARRMSMSTTITCRNLADGI